MNREWIVLKFGGTSVSSLSSLQTIHNICEKKIQKGHKVLVVCSAKSGISNKLEALISLSTKNKYEDLLLEIKKEHQKFCQALEIAPAETLLQSEFDELTKITLGISLLGSCKAQVVARLMSLGELMLTKIVGEWLGARMDIHWVDVRHILKTKTGQTSHHCESRSYLSASSLLESGEHISNFLEEKRSNCFITQGFIANNQKNETVLLGRGGSDITATYLGAALQATSVEIWTDVPGMFTANPRSLSSARLLKHLHYEEARELASSGAKVLHPKCIDFLSRKKIPLVIAWTQRPKQQGTIIDHHTQENGAQVKAVATKSSVYVISLESAGMWQEVGFLADVFSCFKKHDISIDLIATSQSTITVTLDSFTTSLDESTLDFLMEDLSRICHAKKIGPCAVVNLVGRRIRAILPVIGPMLEAFRERSIHLISQSASDLNFSFVVAQDDLGKIVEHLHRLCFESLHRCSWLGPSWQELSFKQSNRLHSSDKPKWWARKIGDLISLGKDHSPLYVYDQGTARKAAKSLLAVKGISRVNYALKANYHSDLLKVFYEEGLSFDCVSWDEVIYLKKLFPDISSDRIVFTPNFAPIGEYEQAMQHGCLVTLDNLHPLVHHPQVFKKKSIMIRIDPGAGKGHHRFVNTAGTSSKFGIAIVDLPLMTKLVKQHEIRIVGLHAHVGSGILDVDTWQKLASFLVHVAKDFPDVHILDIGGGFGVPEKRHQSPLNLKNLAEVFKNFWDTLSPYEIWIEPGRYLVAEAGVLLTKVTQTKKKNHKNFVGVDTGMNSFIRHSLYGSFHELTNITQQESCDYIHTDIVGPICESGDVFGYNRLLPASTKEGDIILVDNAGAYGRTMASSYNLRMPAKEWLLT